MDTEYSHDLTGKDTRILEDAMLTEELLDNDDGLASLGSAEEFLEYFDIEYDSAAVRERRWQILQGFHDYLAEIEQMPDRPEQRHALYADLLAGAYYDAIHGAKALQGSSPCASCGAPQQTGCAINPAAGADRFDYGAAVRVSRTIRNDGSYPGLARGELLVIRGSVGYVRDVGTFLQDQVIYAVYFPDADKLVGCRATELQPAEAPWMPSEFEFRDQVAARIPLGIDGEVIVASGEVGQVMKVVREAPGGVAYYVHFAGRNVLQVPETALIPPPAEIAQPSAEVA